MRTRRPTRYSASGHVGAPRGRPFPNSQADALFPRLRVVMRFPASSRRRRDRRPRRHRFRSHRRAGKSCSTCSRMESKAPPVAIASAPNHDYLKDLGADVTFDYRAEDVVSSVAEQLGSVDAVADLGWRRCRRTQAWAFVCASRVEYWIVTGSESKSASLFQSIVESRSASSPIASRRPAPACRTSVIGRGIPSSRHIVIGVDGADPARLLAGVGGQCARELAEASWRPLCGRRGRSLFPGLVKRGVWSSTVRSTGAWGVRNAAFRDPDGHIWAFSADIPRTDHLPGRLRGRVGTLRERVPGARARQVGPERLGACLQCGPEYGQIGVVRQFQGCQFLGGEPCDGVVLLGSQVRRPAVPVGDWPDVHLDLGRANPVEWVPR